MPKSSKRDEDEQPAELDSRRGSLRQTAQAFRSHDEARAHEIARQARRSPYERMVKFMELQERVWGPHNPDVRESGVVNVERRDD